MSTNLISTNFKECYSIYALTYPGLVILTFDNILRSAPGEFVHGIVDGLKVLVGHPAHIQIIGSFRGVGGFFAFFADL